MNEMKTCASVRAGAWLLVLCMLLALTGCGAKPAEAPEPTAETQITVRDSREIIEELAVYYGSAGDAAEGRVAALLAELAAADPDAAARWTRIMALWKDVNGDLDLNDGVLPDGLPDTDALGIIVLGFQLAPDGSMREELVERLGVALRSAEKYPRALVVCTGGGTAANDPSATEAGRMAEWLTDHGLAPERVIVEDRSLTTAQNAVFTFDILEARCPQVTQLAIVSSDYHIATGTLLFGAEAILRAKQAGAETVSVVSNAAYKAPSGTLSTMFQAGALIELSGDTETAFEIYYDTYDIHALPPLKTDG